MKLWHPVHNKLNENHINDQLKPSMNDKTKNDEIEDLIPSIIQYAQFMNDNDHSFLTKLSRADSVLQRTKLNQHNGALVKYKKPSKSWQELIQRYYKNNKHCDLK